MVLFKEIRIYILFFILFGLWSTWWQSSKYKSEIKFYSVFSVALVFCDFLSAIFLDKFYASISLSNIVANSWYTAIVITHFIIVVESIVQKSAQVNLIRNLALVDQLFNIKSKVIIPYYKEKREIFIRSSILILIVISVDVLIIFSAYYRELHFNLMYPAMYSNTMMRLRPIQVLFFVYLMRTRLILINKELKAIQNETILKSYTTNHTKSNHSNHTKMTLNSTPEVLLNRRLMNLKQIYGSLYESCELISKVFGCSLVAFTMQTFVEFTFNCYWGYVCLYEKKCLWANLLVPNILLLGILAFYCSSCYQYVSTGKVTRI